jgi:hypothetical protein
MRRPSYLDLLTVIVAFLVAGLIGLAVHYLDDRSGCRPAVEGPVSALRCPDGSTP